MNRAEINKMQSGELRALIASLAAELETVKREAREREQKFRSTLQGMDEGIASSRKAHARDLREKDDLISMLQKAVAAHDSERLALKKENKKLKSENARLAAELEKTQDAADRLRASLKKDSTMSSKPPSTDAFRKMAVSLPKEKSGKKPGGQIGHAGHTLRMLQDPTDVIDKKPAHICGCGGEVELFPGFHAKQNVDARVVLSITEERVHTGLCTKCGKVHAGVFSEGFVNPVGYGANLKAIVACLNAYANVPVNKTAEFISSITGGKVNISDGTVVNIVHELASKLDATIDAIKARLISGGALGVDETGLYVNGGQAWLQIFAGNDSVLFGRNDKRSGFCHEGADLIEMFTGILVHDHLSSYYRYKHLSHAECNTHALRYLTAVIEILKHNWAKDMAALLRDANERRNVRIAAGMHSLSDGEAESVRKQYMAILDTGDAEYKTATEGKSNISYYDEERKLLRRLRKFADQHLLFLTNFDVPFTNNLSEHGARFAKSKMKTAGCFRSYKGADDYARNASLIATLRKQGIGVYGAIRGVFSGIDPPFVTAEIESG